MTALGWGPGPSLIFGVIFIMICSIFTQQAFAAPVYEHETGLEALHEELNNGCYYNFQHYDEGDRILTNEPCLNCTCHNRMLMCYLRVCPFTKAIGENCKIEKREDQCCPVITCPEVPVHLLTSTTASPSAATDSTELGHLDNYGCTVNELFYSDGARVPSDPSKPCELCYCIRNKTTCIMQECTLHVQGCKPVYQDGVCCPVRYDCDREEEYLLETTVSSGLLLTTTMSPGASTDCKYNSSVYSDGELMKTENACEHCYCMRGEIVCAVQECGQPMEKTGTNCVAIPREGQCCPEYECDNATFTTTLSPSDELTTALTNEEVSTESKYPLEGEVAPTVDKLHKADDSGIAETESLPTAEHTTEHINVDELSKSPEPEEVATEDIKLNLPQEKDTTTDKYEHAPATTEPIEKLSHDVTSPDSDGLGVTTSSQALDEQKPTDIPDMIHSEDTTKYNLAVAEGENQILEQGKIDQESETPKPEISVDDQSTSSHDFSGEELITRIYDDLPKEIVTESVNVEETPAPSVSKPEDELSPPKEETSSVASEDSTRLAEDVITTEHSKPESESLEPSTTAPALESDSDAIQPIDVSGDKAPATEQTIDESTRVPDIQAVVSDDKDTSESELDQDLTPSPETAKHTTPSSDLITEEHTEDKYHEEQTTVKSESEATDITEKVSLTTDEPKNILPETITEQSIAVDSTSSSEKDSELGHTVENVDTNVSDVEIPHTTENINLSSDDRKDIDEQIPIEVSTELGSEPVVFEQDVTTEKAIEQENEVPEIPVENQPETSEKSIDSETTEKPLYSEFGSTEKHLPPGEQIETTVNPLSGEEQEVETSEKPTEGHDEESEIPQISDHTEETYKEPSQADEQPEVSEKPGSEYTPETTPYADDNQLETSEKSVETDHSQEIEEPIDNSIQEQELSVTEKQPESDIQPEISTQPIISDRFPDVQEGEYDKTESNEITPYSTETPSEGSSQPETSDKPVESDGIKPDTSEKPVEAIENELATTDKYDTSDEQRIVTEKTPDGEEHESEQPVGTSEQEDISEKPVHSSEIDSVTSEEPSSFIEQQETEKPDERIYVTEVYGKPSDGEESVSITSEKPADEQEQIPETSEKPVDVEESVSITSEKPADEQEQIPETSEKPVDVEEPVAFTSEKPVDEQEQITETSEKPVDVEEPVAVTSEKPVDVEEPVAVTSEKPAEDEEIVAVTSEKPADDEELVDVTSEKPADDAELVAVTSEKSVDGEDSIAVTTEKSVDVQEQISEVTEKPTDGEIPSLETSETPIENTEQVPEATEKPVESEDKILESTEKPTDSEDKLSEVTEKSVDTEGQVFETSEIPADTTETVPELTEKTILTGEESPEMAEKPADNEDEAPESSEKPIVEDTVGTSEKTTASEDEAPGISEKPIESETLETGVTDAQKEIEQTPSNEIDQTRGEDSQGTENPPPESVDVQGPITEVPESLEDVTTHHIKPETELQQSTESPTEPNIDISAAGIPEEQPSISQEKETTQSTELLKQPEGVSEISSTEEDVTKTIPVGEDKLTSQPEEESQKTEAPIVVDEPKPEVSTENVLLQSEHHVIPGEGDCLVDDVTYANNSIVQPTNPCQLSCKCISSIVQCEMIECSPPPSDMVKCMPIFHGDDNCCPTYNCEGTEGKTPPSDSHILEKLPEVENIPGDVAQTEATPEPETTKESESIPDVIVPVVPLEEDISTEIPDKDNNIPTQSPVDTVESETDEISPSKDTPADESTSGLIGTPIDKITESSVTETEVELATERLGPIDTIEHEDTEGEVSNTTPKLDSITEKSDLPLETEVSSEQPELITIKHEQPVEVPVELTTSDYPNEILPTTSSHENIPVQVEVESSTAIPESVPTDTSGIDSNEIPSGEISTEPEISVPEITTEHASIDVTTQTSKTPSESFPQDENEVLYTSKPEAIPSKKPEDSYTTVPSQENIDVEKTTEFISEISTEGVKVQETETEHFIIELGDISTKPSKEVDIEESNEVPEVPLESTKIPDIEQDKDVTSAPIAEEEITVTSQDVQESVTTGAQPISHDENEIPTFDNIPVQPVTEKLLDEDESKSTSLPISSSDSNEEIPDYTASIPSDDTRAETVAPVLPVETSTEYLEQKVTDRVAPDSVTDLPVKVEETEVTESNIVETEKPEASVSPTEEPSVTVQTLFEVTEISTDIIKEATESGSESETPKTDIGASVPETQTDKPLESEANAIPDADIVSEHSTITPVEENQETEKPHDAATEVESTTLAEDRIPHVPDNENELIPEEHISETSTSIPLEERTTLTNEVISQTDIASQKPEFEQEPSVADISTEANEIITDEPKDIQKPEDGESLSVNEPTEDIKIFETTVTPDNSQENIEQSSETSPNEIDNRINLVDESEEIEKEQTEQPVTVAVSVETSSEQVIGEEHTETSIEPEVLGADQESNVQLEEKVTEEIPKATTQYLEPTTIKTSIEESSEEKQQTSSEEQPISETTENKLVEISTESQPISPEQTTILASDNLQTEATPKDTIPDSNQETGGEISSELDTTTQSEVQKLDTSSEGSPINEVSGDKLEEPEPVLSVTEVSEVEESSKETGESVTGDITTKYPTEDQSAASLPVEQEGVKPSVPVHIPSEQTTVDALPELSTLTSEENIEPEVTEAPITTTIKQESSSTKDDAMEITTVSKLPELSTSTPQVSTEKSDEIVTVHEDISDGELKPAQDDKQTSDVPSISSQEPDYVQVPIEQSPEPSEEPSQEVSTSGSVFESSTTQSSYSTQDSLNVTSPPRIPDEESQKPVKPDYQPQHPDDFGQMPQQYPYPPETDDYDEDDSTAFGPGTCRYGGKVYVSAQQIPRDDPCDFCFCFRSDIICLQQSCPPPIPGCHEEPINGFCCPRYECPVSMATVLNVTTTTTTTTTTLPPHFLHHAYKGAASRRGCQIQGKAYQVGEVVKSKSGPCLHCTCGGDGQMKCDPKVCSPQPMIQQMIAAVATSRTGARR
ncbi:titin [Chrysoperla carnea]|uniref:titin n=1 Tax=Chrysoperla carnea TaxID=189513 RepID=UPI001D05FA9B|nr:titin [Chrysoperla carnea]